MIIVECYGDEALLKCLGFGNLTHLFGSGEVGNKLAISNNKIAMIDADPGKTKHKYFQNLKLYKEKNFAIDTYKDIIKINYVIQLDPDLEGFILKMSKESKSIDLLNKYKIPNTKETLHEYLARQRIPTVFESYLKEMIERNTPQLKYLKDTIDEILRLI